jgi:hypothetical protein
MWSINKSAKLSARFSSMVVNVEQVADLRRPKSFTNDGGVPLPSSPTSATFSCSATIVGPNKGIGLVTLPRDLS